jgi:hypothetical protein
MTGEINLKRQDTSIGGLKEKTMAALRSRPSRLRSSRKENERDRRISIRWSETAEFYHHRPHRQNIGLHAGYEGDTGEKGRVRA